MQIAKASSYSYLSSQIKHAISQQQAQQTQAAPNTVAAATTTKLNENTVALAQDNKQSNAEYLKTLQQNSKLIIDNLKTQLESTNSQTKEMDKQAEVERKCFIISMRIMAGDKVPIQDYRYLAKNSPELYSRAIMMRTIKENPKKYKRLSKDEGEDSADTAISSSDNSNVEQTDATGSPTADTSSQEVQPVALDIQA